MDMNSEWEVTKSYAARFTLESLMGTVSVIYCSVELRRRAQFYVMYIILPVVAMSSVSMFVFALPAESGEKISLGISVLISYTVLTLLVADTMPTNADAMPVLSRYPHHADQRRRHASSQ